MPYADREEQLEFLRNYYPAYREEHEKEIKKRQAEWFQANREHVATRRRYNRSLERTRPAVEAMSEQWQALAKGMAMARAEDPDLDARVLRGLAEQFPLSEWRRFVDHCTTRRERAFWLSVRDV